MKNHYALFCAALLLSSCAGNSPFTPASAPESGKIPVKVIASANASGDASTGSSTAYTGGVQVVFGSGVPLSARQKFLKQLGLSTAPPAPK